MDSVHRFYDSFFAGVLVNRSIPDTPPDSGSQLPARSSQNQDASSHPGPSSTPRTSTEGPSSPVAGPSNIPRVPEGASESHRELEPDAGSATHASNTAYPATAHNHWKLVMTSDYAAHSRPVCQPCCGPLPAGCSVLMSLL